MSSQSTTQMALPFAQADKASFANFLVGRNTELVAALNMAAIQNTQHKAVYFYGTEGSGKSHLLFATLRAAQAQKTTYLSLSDQRVIPEMLAISDVAGLICIDNIQAWAGDEAKERALFTLFEQVKHAAGRLICSANQPPETAGFKINDLVSRLSSDLIYPVFELNDDERPQAIQLRADQRGLKIADDAINYLLKRSSRDTHELFVILDRIDKASLVEQRRITIPFLQSLFRDS